MPLLGLVLLVLPMPNLVPFKDLVSAVIVVVIIIPISVLRSMVTLIGLMTTKLVCMAPKATCTITQGKTDFPTPSAHLCDSDTLPGIRSNTWIINTSSSNHMTCDDKLFDESSSNPLDLYITNANGLPLLVTEKTSQHLDLDQSPMFGDEQIALGDEMIGRTEESNRSLVRENSDSCDSCVAEFDARPSFAQPLLQSNCDSEIVTLFDIKNAFLHGDLNE
ncbi:unnamed protein product [Prunus brigantina]